MELKGKVAVVTGGAVRVGRAISLALAGAGAHVVLHYGSSTQDAEETCREIEKLGSRAAAVRADLYRPSEAAPTVFEAVRAKFGRADILVNSAAIFEPAKLESVNDEQWDRHFSINLKAPVFFSRAFVEQLEPEQRGHIVSIADWRAMRPIVGHLPYTLTKAGIVAMTKELALELAPRVQVNAIAPGAILPPPGKEADYLARLSAHIPLRRTGSPKDVTETLLFLLRSDFITGEIVHVTGGEQL